MPINPTKQKVVETAIDLFFHNGFHGTSVRDIAQKAGVNVSLISYYFQGKQGLLEYVVTDYYEAYLALLEQTAASSTDMDKVSRLKQLIFTILDYKSAHTQLTSFIHRELSLDSTFVREMTVTYLAKEEHIIHTLFAPIIAGQSATRKDYLYLQFKGMLLAPYIVKSERKHHILDDMMRVQFVEQYAKVMNEWVAFLG